MFRFAICPQLCRSIFASSAAFYHIKPAKIILKPTKNEPIKRTFPSASVNLEKIHFHSFLGKDIINMANVVYMITMSDTWKYIDVVSGGGKLWQSVDSHLTNVLSPVYQHIHLMESVAITEVTVLEHGSEGEELRERMKLIVKEWGHDELINIEHNRFGQRSKLAQIYLVARGGKLLDLN